MLVILPHVQHIKLDRVYKSKLLTYSPDEKMKDLKCYHL